jgi:hypothetical protein
MTEPTFVFARYESRNFMFSALGYNEKQAREALEVALVRHCAQYDAILSDFYQPEDIYFYTLKPGDGMRDDEVISHMALRKP